MPELSLKNFLLFGLRFYCLLCFNCTDDEDYFTDVDGSGDYESSGYSENSKGIPKEAHLNISWVTLLKSIKNNR